MRQWRLVFFPNESPFTIFCPDGQCHVYQRHWEHSANVCVIERDGFGGSVMVLGGISYGVKSPLVVGAGNLTTIRYRDEISRQVAVQCNNITTFFSMTMPYPM